MKDTHVSLYAANAVLSRVFGHPGFRGLQAEAVAEILSGRDVVAVLPTGGGKSICYQVPALMRPGVALVVSPLIALMQDQVAALEAAGVAAARLDSSLPPNERARTLERIAEGSLSLLYLSPEGLASSALIDRLRAAQLSLIAIDEAHCVSQWGHDFRPDYRALGRLAELFPGVPRIAVTATADAPTRADIIRQLRLENARVLVASFDRPNLALAAERKGAKPQERIVDLVRARPNRSGIVYAATRDGVETIAAALAAHGAPALAYHAGLDAETRAARQRRFQAEDDVVMAATIAFGMGVDKPDVRFVIHADPPKSIEAYWQEVGRAGRDGEPGEAIALYGAVDLRRNLRFAADGGAPPEIQQAQARKANALFAFLDSLACRRAAVRRYFGEQNVSPCGACDNCLDPPASIDVSEPAAKALSAVARLGERYGRGRVIEHLSGKEPRDDIAARAASLSTFGIGADLDEPTWRRILDQLLFEGLLREDDNAQRPILKLGAGDDVRAVFRKEREVRMRAEAPRTRRTPEERRAAKLGRSVARNDLDEASAARFEALREWRRAEAASAKVPPYVIFSDKTLVAAAQIRPRTLADLSLVSGIGDVKRAKYGAALLAVLDEVDS